jgi:SIR2-like domain
MQPPAALESIARGEIRRSPSRAEAVSASADYLAQHYDLVADEIALRGKVIPILGAGVNLSGRPHDARWHASADYLPSGSELAEHLAEHFRYPGADASDLMRVSQFALTARGDGPLYDELHRVFEVKYAPGPLHRFLASLPPLLRARKLPQQLIVTTNYDYALELAFIEAKEKFDLVAYSLGEDGRARFWHVPPGGEPILIRSPNDYNDVSTDVQTVILKIHGSVDRRSPPDRDFETFVITEDDYIDYLAHAEPLNLFPVRIAAVLKTSHLLFLGYGLKDWNLRVLLRRLWRDQRRHYASWAVQLHPDPIELRFWSTRGLEVLDADIGTYVEEVGRRVTAVAAAET